MEAGGVGVEVAAAEDEAGGAGVKTFCLVDEVVEVDEDNGTRQTGGIAALARMALLALAGAPGKTQSAWFWHRGHGELQTRYQGLDRTDGTGLNAPRWGPRPLL